MGGCDLTNDAEPAKIVVVGERVLLRYVDELGGEHFTRLMYVTPTGIVEWRKVNINVSIPIGTVESDDEGYCIRIPIPDYREHMDC